MNNPANNRCTIGCDGTQDGLGPDRVELATLIGRSPNPYPLGDGLEVL